MNRISPKQVSFSLSFISFEVRLKKAKKIGIAPHAILGIASISLLAATVKFTRLPVTLLSPLITPAKSFVPPIFTAKSCGNVLPLAWVFCRAIKTGNIKNAAMPMPSPVNTTILRIFTPNILKLCQRAML